MKMGYIANIYKSGLTVASLTALNQRGAFMKHMDPTEPPTLIEEDGSAILGHTEKSKHLFWNIWKAWSFFLPKFLPGVLETGLGR